MFSWTLFIITNEKGAECSKILNHFIHAPLREMMIVDISLYCVVSQRPLCGTLGRLPRPLSLMVPYSRRVMIVLRLSLYSVVLTDVFGPFRSFATSTFDSISPGNKHFVGSGFWPNCLSQCCVCLVSLTVPKPLDSCSTFHKAVVTSRAFTSHFVSWL